MTESKGPGKTGGAAAPAKKKRKGPLRKLRPYAVGIMAIVVVFGGSALIGAHVRAGKDDKVAAPTGAVGPAVVPTGPADPSATASPSPSASSGPNFQVPVRPAVPVTITVYEDLRSPDSKAFADEYADVLRQMLTTGQVQVHYQLVTASDGKYGGKSAEFAANAAACAQDQSRFTQFVQEIWDHQPDPHSGALGNEKLIKSLAHKAKKIKMANFEPCIEQGDHNGWVIKSQADFAHSGLGEVPALEINGKPVKDVRTSLTPDKLRSMVDKEAKRVIAIQATPSASPTQS
ncbi:Thioredoxin [Actinacidiphila yanglinensis]|uniref:Thioredoxin n=1 Tax=Actinacidiphila yanglinensis TaxID=310779 RepID=A0A1H5XAH1_9ACTN|nr:thioredoxin domain-containing protein [Actinacidiphila yanglinensis]SEG08643.1 Thioredoxin [Actinacidiphila yanglinensis]